MNLVGLVSIFCYFITHFVDELDHIDFEKENTFDNLKKFRMTQNSFWSLQTVFLTQRVATLFTVVFVLIFHNKNVFLI